MVRISNRLTLISGTITLYYSLSVVPGQENPCKKIIGQIHAHAKLTSKWGGHVGTDRSIRWVRHVDTYSILAPKPSSYVCLGYSFLSSVLVSGLPCCRPALGCYSLALRGFLPTSLLQDLPHLACKVAYIM